MPNTYIKDGDILIRKIGAIRPIHYVTFYYIVKIYLTRFGYFRSSNSCVIAIAISLIVECGARLLAYIRVGQAITTWWIMGMLMAIFVIALNYIDDLLYEVRYEPYDENNN